LAILDRARALGLLGDIYEHSGAKVSSLFVDKPLIACAALVGLIIVVHAKKLVGSFFKATTLS